MFADKSREGYYDKDGNWIRNKYCFVYCGADRCNCGPPLGVYKKEKDKDDKEERSKA